MQRNNFFLMNGNRHSSLPFLFSLEQCVKCTATKEYLERKGIEVKIIVLPKNLKEWTEEQKDIVYKFDVLDKI